MSMLDWQAAVIKLHELYPFKKVLEFGLGDGTQWFLDNCEHVKSLEIHSNPETAGWFGDCVERFKEYTNWEPILFASDGDMKLTDGMTDFICNHLFDRAAAKQYDLIFVDPGVHCRGDIVNLCFGHSPVIVIHDTNVGHENYGWTKMAGKGYYRIDTTYCSPEGVTFWIKDESLYNKLLKSLSE